MKKCLVVINEMSGRAAKINADKLREKFGAAYDVDFAYIRGADDEWSADGYSLVVACGGDGTFNRALNRCSASGANLVYYGFGTFNECAKAKGRDKTASEFIRLYEYASVGGSYFGYVAATGSFTPLGYVVNCEQKQKMGILAYLLKVVREYKVWDIGAEITADGKNYRGRYTLIMAIDSMRCFGFRFNKLYRPDDGKVHLLLVKSPGKNTLTNKIKIFFPLFRAFFIGFRKETERGNIFFRAVSDIKITTDRPYVYDVDGDAAEPGITAHIKVEKTQTKVYIGDLDMIK